MHFFSLAHDHHAPTPARYPAIQLNSDIIYSTGVGLSPARLFFPFQMPVTSPGASDQQAIYRSEVPATPSLGLTNLLEWRTELRDTVHLQVHWLVIKDCNSGTAR